MQKIDINLATRKSGSKSLPWLIAIALAIIASAYTWYNIDGYSRNSSEIASYAGRVNVPSAQDVDAGAFDIDSLRHGAELINSLVAKKRFSWTLLLTRLEETVPDGVHIVQITPDFGGGLKITGAAGRVEEALRMVDAMGASVHFKDVFLLKHSGGKGAAPVIFDISARYRGEGA